jgi:hypothetical protein
LNVCARRRLIMISGAGKQIKKVHRVLREGIQ